jgi:endo-1,4-beta-D-glucanase Y
MAGEDADAHTLFDGLWEFFNDHRSEIDSRLMDWQVPADESPQPGYDDSAFDGDCDIAYALLLAERQWGTNGRVDYRASFDNVVAGILASTIGPDSKLPLLGDWVDPSGTDHNQYTTRSSDYMPGHFRVFRLATGNTTWEAVVTACQQVISSLQANHSSVTGLLPDFVVPASAQDHAPQPAAPDFLEGAHDGHYYYNAGRVPWRLGTDALLSGDTTSRSQVQALSSWIRTATGGDPQNIKGGYELDGTAIGDYFTTFFAAPFGVAAMLDPLGQQWLNDVYDSVRSTREGYFEDTVTLLAMLVMTRNFWDPHQALFADGFETGDTSYWSATAP